MDTTGLDVHAVFERFHTLRGQILSVVDDTTPLVEALGPFRSELVPWLERVRRAVDQSRLNVVVIGAEGHGKSTLINALTGLDVTPSSEQEPGTVAPVYVEWADSAEPVRSVFVSSDGGAVEVRCPDTETFGSYLLQAHNKDNEKQVVSGSIRFDHPMLRNGLRLVDMPGVEGVSQTVSQAASQFIDEAANTVIAVCKDRGYGPLTRVASNLSRRDEIEIDACISNWTLDFWFGSDDELAAKVSAQRRIVVERISDEGGGLVLEPDRIFVLHLKTLSLPDGSQNTVTSPVHTQEEEALRRHIADRLHRYGLDAVILDGVEHAERALNTLRSHFSSRRRLLEALLSGTESAEQIAADLAAAADSARSFWSETASPAVVRAVAAQEWDVLRPAIETARERVLGFIRELRQEIDGREDSSGRISKAEARRFHDRLVDRVSDEFGGVEAEQRRIVDDLATRYLDVANDALTQVYAQVPAVTPKDGSYRLDVDGLVAFEWSRLDEDQAGLFAKMMSAGAVGSAGGAIAGFGGGGALIGLAGLGPIGAGIAGALGAAALGWALIDWMRGGRRSAVLKGLEKAESTMRLTDLSPSSDIRSSWDAMTVDLADKVGDYLQSRLDAIVALASDPDPADETLKRELAAVDAADDTASALEGRLKDIGTAAGQAI